MENFNNSNWFIDRNIIYPNVKLGDNYILYPPVVLGQAPRGKKIGELELKIGDNAIIRPFTVIYAGSTFGNNFQTGQGTSIRENNTIGDNVSIGTRTVLEFNNKIGNNVRIHTGCFLELTTIEDNVFIGPNVTFTDDPHPPCPKYKECVGGPVVKKNAKIGAGAVILPGVIIGENSLVGAGAVVVDDVPPDSVVAGVPAKIICEISELKCYPEFYEKPYIW